MNVGASLRGRWRRLRRRLDLDDEMNRWPVRVSTLLRVAVLCALTLALLGLLVVTVISLRSRGATVWPPWLAWFDANCEDAAFSCAVVAGALVAPIPIVLGVLGLLAWRLGRIRRRYQRHAREKAPALVQTAAGGDRIVGRDALCAELKRNIEDRDTRLPHVLVGGVGVGKTAVLVRMTRLLAKHGAVPVPVRLRDAQDPRELDFGDLARRRFLRTVDRFVFSGAEGDKIWRTLREQDRVVVLADGLEEALLSPEHRATRDTTIRAAFAHARDNRLPVLVTSRPQPTLRDLEAAILRIEPLSEGSALGFIRGNRSGTDPKVRLIVESAEVVEAPLYMQLAQALDQRKLLTKLDARCATRLALRIHLLDTWHDNLVAGKLCPKVPQPPPERKQALEDLALLAIEGLLQDSLEVDFSVETAHHGLEYRDVHVSAGVGGRLEVVEAHSGGVRFRHSVVQAYLGSRRILEVPEMKLREALGRAGGPGRELLMALVMACWRPEAAELRPALRDLLGGIDRPQDAKSVDLFAAAAEIDGMIDGRDSDWIAKAIEAHWPALLDESVAEAKLAAIARIGDLARSQGVPTAAEHLHRRSLRAAGSPLSPPKCPIDRDALNALSWIALTEQETYAARIAAAQQIGGAGRTAVEALAADFERALTAATKLYRTKGQPLDEPTKREFTLHAWTLPMLFGSEELDGDARQTLRPVIARWLDLVCDGVHPSIEEAWARGFKFEANRRPHHANLEARNLLAEDAERMLERSQCWFSRITLFHAFTLWGLDGDDEGNRVDGDARSRGRRKDRKEARARARRIVDGWEVDGSHPFLAETAWLCQKALRTRQPGRYIWIDETGIVAKLGPSSSRPEDIPNSRLWISPAAGWVALHPRARRLVGELILTLNLAEGVDSNRREERMSRLGQASGLPPCLTQRAGRAALHVDGGQNGGGPRPGSTCVSGCKIHLCPYAPPGQAPPRGELSEAFCRAQINSLDHHVPRVPRREAVSDRELKDFWEAMEERARL